MTRPVEALAGAAVLLCAAGGAAMALRAVASGARATGRGIASGAARAWRPIASVARGRAARQIASLQGIQADQAAALSALAALLIQERAARGEVPASHAPAASAPRPAQRVLETSCREVAPPPATRHVAPRQAPLGPDELSALVLGLERRVVS